MSVELLSCNTSTLTGFFLDPCRSIFPENNLSSLTHTVFIGIINRTSTIPNFIKSYHLQFGFIIGRKCHGISQSRHFIWWRVWNTKRIWIICQITNDFVYVPLFLIGRIEFLYLSTDTTDTMGGK